MYGFAGGGRKYFARRGQRVEFSFARGGYLLKAMGLHAFLAWGVAASLLVGGLLLFFTPTNMRWRTVGRRITLSASLGVLPVVTTGMVAQCQRIWETAGMEDALPNLPWYRLTRHADFATGSAVTWHASIGAVAATLVIVGILASRTLRGRTIVIAATALAVTLVLAMVTAMLIPRSGQISPQQIPAWGDGGWDDPSPGADSVMGTLRLHMLLLGTAMSAAVATIAMCFGPMAPRNRLKLGATVAITLLASAVGINLWMTTGWQASRVAALIVQPRDAAYLFTAVAAIAAMVAFVWVHGRGWRRTRLASASIVLLLLLATLWLAALSLYDGSYRGSPIWRSHRPFVQRPS